MIQILKQTKKYQFLKPFENSFRQILLFYIPKSGERVGWVRTKKLAEAQRIYGMQKKPHSK